MKTSSTAKVGRLFVSTLFAIFFYHLAYTQTTSEIKTSVKKTTNQTEAGPFVFSSQEELERTVPTTIKRLQEMIDSGNHSEEVVQMLRNQIWRFENAIVTEQNK